MLAYNASRSSSCAGRSPWSNSSLRSMARSPSGRPDRCGSPPCGATGVPRRSPQGALGRARRARTQRARLSRSGRWTHASVELSATSLGTRHTTRRTRRSEIPRSAPHRCRVGDRGRRPSPGAHGTPWTFIGKRDARTLWTLTPGSGRSDRVAPRRRVPFGVWSVYLGALAPIAGSAPSRPATWARRYVLRTPGTIDPHPGRGE